MKFILTTILFFTQIILGAQSISKIDSIQSQLNHTNDFEVQQYLRLDLANEFLAISPYKSDSLAKLVWSDSKIKNNVDLYSKTLNLLARINFNEQRDFEALKYFKALDSVLEKNDIQNELLVNSKFQQSQIAKFTFTEQGLALSKVYLEEMLTVAKGMHDQTQIHRSYQAYGNYFGLLADVTKNEDLYDSAIYFFQKALDFFLIEHDTLNISQSYWNLSSVAVRTKEFKQAEEYLLKRVNLLRNVNNLLELGNSYNSLAGFYSRRVQNYEKGLTYYDSAMAVYQKTGFMNQSSRLGIYNGYALTYYDLGRYKEGFEWLDKAYLLKDSLDRNKSREATINFESKYQSDKKQAEIEILEASNKLVLEEKRNQLIAFLGAVVVVFLSALFFFLLYRNRQKTAHKLQEINEMKSTFFANISHEFRTPLTLIKAPAEMQLASEELSETHRQQLSSINRNADRLLDLVDQLLDLSKLEAKKIVLKVRPVQPANWLKAFTQSFQYVAAQKNIKLKVSIECAEEEMMLDPHLLEKVISNLLTNAVKYTNNEGEIIFEATIKAETLHLKIQNTGELISSGNHDKVFERFYQLNTHTTGVGIGLALVKELVELHHGSISLTTSTTHNIFAIEIPINSTAYNKAEIDRTQTEKMNLNGRAQQEIRNKLVENVSEEAFTDDLLNADRSILLIVDDNAEIRRLIKQQFESDYQIEEAENGKIGIQKAISIVPDIIISDIMMPETDGIELTRQLKTDERTSHIPIILLTAKAGEENELIGLENKADDYILKPFSPEKLRLRVQNLIEIRRKLRDRYSQEVILKPKDIAISTHDEIFLEKVQILLDKKLTESEFTSEYFSREIGMSRMQLHRKLKALVGLSTTEFIRSQRLKMATYILLNSDINISEVAYEVGFNDPSYFTKCFKASYGISPGNYAKAQLQK